MICFIYFFFLLWFSILSFIVSLFMLNFDYALIFEYNFMSLNSSVMVFTILIDWMSSLFMSFVMFISSMVILYSEEYMSMEKNLNRFIMLVMMFVLSMILLIISPNLISILLGWDGLGLVSYCLVIYYQNVKSYNAGMLTALTNRIGDVMLLMAIAWMMNYGSWDYVYYLKICKSDFEMTMISWLVFLAALTKSAQIPFSSWLPAAMAAPTPVSSLVHSSTLVTAGVYLLIRFNFIFSQSLQITLLFIASLTMFMAGVGANYEFDLKKIIALSTLSQLGLMMSILALGNYSLAFFHLLIHALFKALLFMCAGNIIHSMGNCQDIRYMGGLVKIMPLTCAYFNIANLSLCGLPFMSGFYSKDLIVEEMSMGILNLYIYLIFYISIGLTVAYSFRLSFYSMIGTSNFLVLGYSKDSFGSMMFGMSGLLFCVVFSGSLVSWVMFPSPYFICLSFLLKIFTLVCILSGGYLGYTISSLNFLNLKKIKSVNFKKFNAFMWNFSFLSTIFINKMPLVLGENLFKNLDQGWSENFGSVGLKKQFLKNTSILNKLFINNLKLFYILVLIWIFLTGFYLNL